MRFIQCQFHIPFFLIGISKLRNEVKGELLNGLKQRERNKIDGLFIFMLNSDEINEYVEILKSFINYRNILNINEQSKEIESKIKELIDIDIINSNNSGVGKTHSIQLFAKNNDFNLNIFPFGNEENDFTIIKRLSEIDFTSYEKNLLLINFYDLKDTRYANNFLFNLLFTKCFRNGENVYILPEFIKIVIELPYSFTDFKSKISMLNYFSCNTINLNSMPLIDKNDKFNF